MAFVKEYTDLGESEFFNARLDLLRFVQKPQYIRFKDHLFSFFKHRCIFIYEFERIAINIFFFSFKIKNMFNLR